MSPKRSKTKNKSSNIGKKVSKKKIPDNSKAGDLTEENSRFIEILNKKFKVFRVSPIYNFTSKRLKFYENKLSEDLNSRKKLSSNDVYKSKLSLNKGLRLSPQCSESLQVEVVKNDSQRAYTGHFISWSKVNSTTEGAVSLPVLLVEGRGHEINRVHSSLCKIFDCDIQPVTFKQVALISFCVKLLEAARGNTDLIEKEQLVLEYKIPGCEANDRIKVAFSLQDTTVAFIVVMESLQAEVEGITATEIIHQFYDKLLNHVFNVYQMDLAFAELHEVTFPDAFITKDGQVKMCTDDAAISTLDVLGHFTPLEAIIGV